MRELKMKTKIYNQKFKPNKKASGRLTASSDLFKEKGGSKAYVQRRN